MSPRGPVDWAAAAGPKRQVACPGPRLAALRAARAYAMPPRVVPLALAGKRLNAPPEAYNAKRELAIKAWLRGVQQAGDLDVPAGQPGGATLTLAAADEPNVSGSPPASDEEGDRQTGVAAWCATRERGGRPLTACLQLLTHVTRMGSVVSAACVHCTTPEWALS
eukprot:96807-Chlamydomonas_euryale.AAC.4